MIPKFVICLIVKFRVLRGLLSAFNKYNSISRGNKCEKLNWIVLTGIKMEKKNIFKQKKVDKIIELLTFWQK